MEGTISKTERSRFIWHELLTTDVDSSADFYSHVIGWTTEPYDFQGEEGPPYTIWRAGEASVGGLMQFDPATMGDMTPGWTGSVHASNVDDLVQRTKDLGGSVLAEPMDLPTVGRMAGIVDPQGASLWILDPESSEPMPEPKSEAGTFSWNELATTDSDAAFDFYSRVFGWTLLDESDMGGGWMYRMYGEGDDVYGGIYNMPPEMSGPPRWQYYIFVEDLDTALTRVRDRGGKVLDGPTEVPGGDVVAQCLDPQGTAFALHSR